MIVLLVWRSDFGFFTFETRTIANEKGVPVIQGDSSVYSSTSTGQRLTIQSVLPVAGWHPPSTTDSHNLPTSLPTLLLPLAPPRNPQPPKLSTSASKHIPIRMPRHQSGTRSRPPTATPYRRPKTSHNLPGLRTCHLHPLSVQRRRARAGLLAASAQVRAVPAYGDGADRAAAEAGVGVSAD